MKNPCFNDVEFKKSSGSLPNGTTYTCVEVAIRKDVVGIRNSNDLQKVTIAFTLDEWKAFILGVKNNEFNF